MSLDEALQLDLDTIAQRGLRRELRVVDGPQSNRIQLDGRSILNFSSNNYLGLANDSDICAAASMSLLEHGFGAGAARLIVGNLTAHIRLEERLAEFHDAAAALLFSSGYQANVGVISALAGPEDVIFSDELNHASIIDGCRLSRAPTYVYRHLDVANLQTLLGRHPARRRFVITDSVFSMDGDLAPLVELRQLTARCNAYLVVDEAHATGIIGPAGRGCCAAMNIVPDVHMATLGKAFGAFGAYVTGSHVLIDFLRHRARSFVFTTALPPSTAAAAFAAVEIVESDRGTELRRNLDARITQFREGLTQRRLLARGVGQTPIFPLAVGDEHRALAVTSHLLAHDIFAQAIRPPTVPRGTSRIRFALSATHTSADIESALQALDSAMANNLISEHAHDQSS